MKAENVVAGVIALNKGQTETRTPLHWKIYLLDRCGANFGFQYFYHMCGPWCSDVEHGIDDALAEKRISMKIGKTAHHGVRLPVFSARENAPLALGDLPASKARDVLERMKEESDFVLEIASAMIFLRDDWDYFNKGSVPVDEEVGNRKPLMATKERMDRARDLLADLGLWEQRPEAVPDSCPSM